MAARPEATSIQVLGSGTTPPPPAPPLAQTFPFPFPGCGLPVLFLPTPQTPGSGGGVIGIHVPLPNGSYKLKGKAGPIEGRLSNADSNGTEGLERAVPAGRNGRGKSPA